jgi:hypothetical protein
MAVDEDISQAFHLSNKLKTKSFKGYTLKVAAFYSGTYRYNSLTSTALQCGRLQVEIMEYSAKR